MSPKFTVAICGGGIGGLICAVALSRYPDIQVDVYEAARQFGEVGAGIGMMPRPWKIMQQLGLDRDLSKVATVASADQPKTIFTLRKGDQPEGQNFHTLVTPGGMTTFHRPEFQAVLLRHLANSCRTYTNKRLHSYSQPTHHSRHSLSYSPTTLFFLDGSTAECDILIGADGVKSVVRATMFEDLALHAEGRGNMQEAKNLRRAASPVWSGTSAYRATIPAEALRARLPDHRVLTEPMVYFGKDTQLTVYPIARGTIINFAAMRARYDLENTTLPSTSWIESAPREALLDNFHKWESEVQALFQCVPKYTRWAIHTTARLPTFVSGRVALLGDAAHAMMPYQGSGAGQAIEDAYLLSTLLGHRRTTLSTISRALHIYDAVRRPFAQSVADRSRESGLLYTLNYPGLTPDRLSESPQKLAEIAARIRDSWAWAWETTIDDDVDRAIRMLES